MNQAKIQSRLLPYLRLQFHINNPTLDEVWSEGYDAANMAIDEVKNPYRSNSKEFDYWDQGWWAGFYGEEHMANSVFSHDMANETSIETAALLGTGAVNDSEWLLPTYKKWIGRAVVAAGVVAATIAAIELLDIAS